MVLGKRYSHSPLGGSMGSVEVASIAVTYCAFYPGTRPCAIMEVIAVKSRSCGVEGFSCSTREAPVSLSTPSIPCKPTNLKGGRVYTLPKTCLPTGRSGEGETVSTRHH